jgi:predicted metalloprotease with PDZ domain
MDEIVLLEFAGGLADLGGGRVVGGGLMQLSLDRNWRGGDAALAGLGDISELAHIELNHTRLTDKSLVHLAKVANLRQLNLYQAGFSRDGLLKFHRQRPEVIIYARGDAMMGIHGDLSSSPLVLTSIYEGSGAFEAGLLAGDVVHEIDGVKIRDFSDLTIYVASKTSGDKIKVQYERDGKKQTAEVTLKPRVD